MSKKLHIVKYTIILVILFSFSNSHAAGLFGFGKKQSKIKIGEQVPDFSGKYFNIQECKKEEEVTYSKDLKGKIVVLDFWSIYCVSCLQEIPKLDDIYKRYKDKDVVFIGVDLDTNKRRLCLFGDNPQNAISSYRIIMDKTKAIANLFNVSILPTTLIIDKEGKLVFLHEGYKAGDEDEIEEVIHKLTSE